MKKERKVEDMSIKELDSFLKSKKEQVDKVTKKEVGVWSVGQNYFIRTVTMSLMGRLECVDEHELVLSDASWIADTGRFSDFLNGEFKEGKLEVEPFPDRVIVGRGSVIDACLWMHDLLRTQK